MKKFLIIFLILACISGISQCGKDTETNNITDEITLSMSETVKTSSNIKENDSMAVVESTVAAEKTTVIEQTTVSEKITVVEQATIVEQTTVSEQTTIVDNKEEPIILTFELIAGEQGEYSDSFTLNKGTEFEDTYIVYRIPVGVYSVTNIGKYMTQLNIYSDETHIVDGWEESVDAFVELMDIDETVSITFSDGYHIEIHEPTHLRFEKTADLEQDISINSVIDSLLNKEKFEEETKTKTETETEKTSIETAVAEKTTVAEQTTMAPAPPEKIETTTTVIEQTIVESKTTVVESEPQDNKIVVPCSSMECEELLYAEAVKLFMDAGFLNITALPIEMDYIENVPNGSIISISIDDNPIFGAESRFASEAEIVIFYREIAPKPIEEETVAPAPPEKVETMVWIPTNGGKKYHSRASCSNMKDPEKVTLSEAQGRGFDACQRCH